MGQISNQVAFLPTPLRLLLVLLLLLLLPTLLVSAELRTDSVLGGMVVAVLPVAASVRLRYWLNRRALLPLVVVRHTSVGGAANKPKPCCAIRGPHSPAEVHQFPRPSLPPSPVAGSCTLPLWAVPWVLPLLLSLPALDLDTGP